MQTRWTQMQVRMSNYQISHFNNIDNGLHDADNDSESQSDSDVEDSGNVFDAQCNVPDKIDNNPDDDSKDRSSDLMEGIAEDSGIAGMCASILMSSIHVN